MGFPRAVIAIAVCRGDFDRASNFVEWAWGDSPVSRALGGSQFSEGGAWVPDRLSRDLIELLRPRSVVRAGGAVEVKIHDVGSVDIPKVTDGASGTWIAENANIVASQPAAGQVKLTVKKNGTLVAISKDLLRSGAPGVDAIVRDDIPRAVSQS